MTPDLTKIFPCKVETENWYWNRQLQISLYKVGIDWCIGVPVGWQCRRTKYLVIDHKYNGGYILQWAGRHDFNGSELKAYSAKELIGLLNDQK